MSDVTEAVIAKRAFVLKQALVHDNTEKIVQVSFWLVCNEVIKISIKKDLKNYNLFFLLFFKHHFLITVYLVILTRKSQKTEFVLTSFLAIPFVCQSNIAFIKPYVKLEISRLDLNFKLKEKIGRKKIHCPRLINVTALG